MELVINLKDADLGSSVSQEVDKAVAEIAGGRLLDIMIAETVDKTLGDCAYDRNQRISQLTKDTIKEIVKKSLS
jgi:hypothetical protein